MAEGWWICVPEEHFSVLSLSQLGQLRALDESIGARHCSSGHISRQRSFI